MGLNTVPSPFMKKRLVALASCGLAVLLSTSRVAAEGASWRVTTGDVRIVVPLLPGGAFDATSHALDGTLTVERVNPAILGGEIALDLRTVDTGINLRNQHLREKYL